MKPAALVVVACVILTGCATSLTTQGSMVRVVEKPEVAGMKYLGIVEASSPLTGVARESGYRNALNEAMNKAGAMGATHIVLDERSKPRYWVTSIIVRAEAYVSSR